MNREDYGPIEVYCDDDRHARGKVAEVAELMVIGPRPWRWTLSPGPKRNAEQARRKRQTDQRLSLRRRPASVVRDGAWHHELPCPLCPRSPQWSDATLQAAADALAAFGKDRVSLSELEAVAAKVRGDGRAEAGLK